jgi:hypothetical protein
MPTGAVNGSLWLDTDATSTSIFEQYWRKAITTAGSTISGNDDYSLALAYTVGFESVFLNGVLLVRAVDYTATNGTSIVLATPTIVGDYVEIITTATFVAADTYTQAAANALFIPDAIVDAKGDIIAATASDTVTRLAVGANNLVLTADSAETTGLKWTGNWITYTPAWTATTTNPVIGNGTVQGGYRRIGNLVEFWIFLVAGSTTTYGSGIYQLSLPVTLTSNNFNFGYQVAILDDGVAWYPVTFIGQGVSSGFNDKFIVSNNTGNLWAPTFPFTFGTNDQIYVQGRYRVS